MDSNPIYHPSSVHKMKCSFFGLCSTSDDWPGWSMDLKSHPPPFSCKKKKKKMKCSFLSMWYFHSGQCAPPEMKISEISAQMRHFGGKRWEKLWITWNWPFWVNLSLILGKNLQNAQNWPFLANITHFLAKFAIVGHFEPVWCERNWKSWISGQHDILVLGHVPTHPRNENFWDSCSNDTLWWQKMEKVVNCMKLAILSESEPHSGEKPAKCPKLAILSQYNPLFQQNSPL